MQSEDYRETLEDALKNLFEVNRRIYDSIIPVAMTGELTHIAAKASSTVKI